MKESNLIERISNSALPALYRKKLCFDLETIFQSNLPELKRDILLGSCARNPFILKRTSRHRIAGLCRKSGKME